MTKYILLGDVHIDYFKDVDFHHDMFSQVMELVLDYMNKNSIRTIIFMGDIFDSRKSPNTKSVLFIVNFLNNFLNKNQHINIYMITGNHDVYYKDTNEISSLDYFNHDRITVIKEPFVLGNMLLLPWITQDNQSNIMDTISNTKCDYCLGHFEFAGFKQHPHDKYLSKGISITEFSKFKRVISGHIHYSSTMNNVTYTGSLLQLKKDDKQDPKKVWVLDTETDDLISINHNIDLMVDLCITNDFKIGNYHNKKVYIDVAQGVSDDFLDGILESIRLQKPISVNIYNNPNKIIITKDIDYENVDNKTSLDYVSDYLNNIECEGIDKNAIFSIIKNYYEGVINNSLNI